MREPDNHPSDSIGEARQGEAQATFDVHPQHFTDLDVGLPNLNLDHHAAPSRRGSPSRAPRH
jgi:hypothetical protein